jgi:predicted dehydrogenase
MVNPRPTMRIAIVGCGYVAELYMRTLKLHPILTVVAAMDVVSTSANRFSAYWQIPVFSNADDLIKNAAFDMILNLTNPHSHYEVTKYFLEHGKHVYSEKPLAQNFEDARALVSLAEAKNILLASAPCNYLGEAAQAVQRALANNLIGTPKLTYAEMDDGFVALSPYRNWVNLSGAHWPYKDEFKVGCTIEHAGYYITWLLLCFGPVKRVVSFQSLRHPGKPVDEGPEASDFSVACLEFCSGMVARLTCSIVAPHDHSLLIVGDKGVLRADDCWFYRTRVHYRSYMRIRGRFMLSPFKKTLRSIATGPRVKRWGAAAMDFGRGPAELAAALFEKRRPYMSAEFSLHVTEVALAIHNSRSDHPSYDMKSTFAPLGQFQNVNV